MTRLDELEIRFQQAAAGVRDAAQTRNLPHLGTLRVHARHQRTARMLKVVATAALFVVAALVTLVPDSGTRASTAVVAANGREVAAFLDLVQPGWKATEAAEDVGGTNDRPTIRRAAYYFSPSPEDAPTLLARISFITGAKGSAAESSFEVMVAPERTATSSSGIKVNLSTIRGSGTLGAWRYDSSRFVVLSVITLDGASVTDGTVVALVDNLSPIGSSKWRELMRTAVGQIRTGPTTTSTVPD